MGVKISELNEAVSIQNQDLLAIVQNGETKKVPAEILLNSKGNVIQKIFTFETLEDMKDELSLVSGNVVQILGVSEVNDGKGAFYQINSNPAGEYEILNNGLYAEKINLTNFSIKTSELGFNNDATNNKNCFAKFINSNYTQLVIDGEYTINGESIEPKRNIILFGGILHINGTLLKANQYNIDVKYLKTDTGILIDVSKGYTTKINNITVDSCTILNTAKIVRANSGGVDSSNYGIESLNIINCDFSNTTEIPFLIYDMPSNTYIKKCRISEMKQRIVTVATENENQFSEEIRKKINLVVENNKVKNTNVITDPYHYTTFVWIKGNSAIANNNIVEGIAIDSMYDTHEAGNLASCHGMYLLANYVKFNNNIFKNIYNFSYQTDSSNSLIECLDIFPLIKGMHGEKNINNNLFIIEESWLIEKCTQLGKNINDLVPPPVWNALTHGDILNINNNIVDSYFGCFTRRRNNFNDNIVNLCNNSFSIKRLSNYFDRNELFSITNTGDYKGEYNIKGNTFNIEHVFNRFMVLSGTDNAININAVIENNVFNFKNSYSVPALIYNVSGNLFLKNNTILVENIQSNARTSSQALIVSKENSNIIGENQIMSKNINGGFSRIFLPAKGFLKLSGIVNLTNLHYTNWFCFVLPTNGSGEAINYNFTLKNISKDIERKGTISLSFLNNIAYLTYRGNTGEITTEVSNLSGGIYTADGDVLFNISNYTIDDVSRKIFYLPSAFFTTNKNDFVELEMKTY